VRGFGTKGRKAQLKTRLRVARSTCQVVEVEAPGEEVQAMPLNVEMEVQQLEAEVSSMTCAALRAELETRGWDTKGRKAQLQARLREARSTPQQASEEEPVVEVHVTVEEEKLALVVEADQKVVVEVEEEDINTMTCAALRARLEALRLDTKGRKAQLQARLLGARSAPKHAEKAKEPEEDNVEAAADEDIGSMTCARLRAELEMRGLETDGRKAHLQARLRKARCSSQQVEDKELVVASVSRKRSSRGSQHSVEAAVPMRDEARPSPAKRARTGRDSSRRKKLKSPQKAVVLQECDASANKRPRAPSRRSRRANEENVAPSKPVEKMLVKELRLELDNLGLSTAGLKKVLVGRLKKALKL